MAKLSETAQIEISGLELLALKKLVIINGALAKKIEDGQAGRGQLALVRVLIDIVNRADLALSAPVPSTASGGGNG